MWLMSFGCVTVSQGKQCMMFWRLSMICSTESTTVTIQIFRNYLHHIPEDLNLQWCQCENLEPPYSLLCLETTWFKTWMKRKSWQSRVWEVWVYHVWDVYACTSIQHQHAASGLFLFQCCHGQACQQQSCHCEVCSHASVSTWDFDPVIVNRTANTILYAFSKYRWSLGEFCCKLLPSAQIACYETPVNIVHSLFPRDPWPLQVH
jgi:hypothetical protein